MTGRDRVLALVVAVVWGVNFVALDVAVAHFPPLFLVALRFALLAVPTLLLVPRPDVPWRWVLGYGLGWGTVQFAFLFLALRAGLPAGLASLVLQASAPFTVLLGALLLSERLGARAAAGTALAVAGLAAIGAHRVQAGALVPVLLALLAALGWAFGNLAARLARPAHPMRLVLWISVVPPVPMLALSAWVEGPTAGLTAVRTAATGGAWPAVLGLIYVVVVSTLVGTGLWTVLLARHPAGVVAPYALLVPVVGVLAAWAALGERPVPVEVVAGVVVVAGVLLGTPRPPAVPVDRSRVPAALGGGAPRTPT